MRRLGVALVLVLAAPPLTAQRETVTTSSTTPAETRTPWIDEARVLVLREGDADVGGSILLLSRWGWLEDHGQPARHRSLEFFDGNDGDRLARRAWEPDEAPRFSVRHSTILFDAEAGPEFATLEPKPGQGSVLGIRSAKTGETRLVTPLPGKTRPRLLRGVGDFDGDGKGDVFALIPGDDSLGTLISSADGRLLGSVPQPLGHGRFDRNLGVAPGPYDLTGDGRDDLVVAARISLMKKENGRVLMVYSGTDRSLVRTLGPYSHAAMGLASDGIDASADLDDDGAHDLVFGCRPFPSTKGPSAVRVASGRSGELLLEFRTRFSGDVETFFLDDQNGDGVEEIFVLAQRENHASDFASAGYEIEASIHSGKDGAVLVSRDLSSLGGIGNPTRVSAQRIADVDGDGHGDVACSVFRMHLDHPDDYALAVLSGTTLKSRFERVLSGESAALVADRAGTQRWRSVDGSEGPLRPPSLDLVQSWPEMELKDFASLEVLRENRLDRRGKSRLDAIRQMPPEARQRARHLFALPWAMRALAPRIHEPPWTEDELDWIEELSVTIATMGTEPLLAIESRDEPAVRTGLARLVAWWEEGCQDQEFVADMVIFLNNGPYYGTAVQPKELEDLPTIDTVELMEGGGRLDMVSGESPPRLYLRHVRENDEVAWCRRLTIQPGEECREEAGLQSDPAEFRPGFGWSVGGYVSWGFGTESATFHLDLDGELRFYELAW